MNILELFTSWDPKPTEGAGVCDGVGLHRLAGCLGLALHLGIILLRALACLFPWRKLSRDAVEWLSKPSADTGLSTYIARSLPRRLDKIRRRWATVSMAHMGLLRMKHRDRVQSTSHACLRPIGFFPRCESLHYFDGGIAESQTPQLLLRENTDQTGIFCSIQVQKLTIARHWCGLRVVCAMSKLVLQHGRVVRSGGRKNPVNYDSVGASGRDGQSTDSF